MTDYRKLCIDLFGTDNETELKDIAGRLKGGRKNKLTETDVKNTSRLQATFADCLLKKQILYL